MNYRISWGGGYDYVDFQAPNDSKAIRKAGLLNRERGYKTGYLLMTWNDGEQPRHLLATGKYVGTIFDIEKAAN